MTTLVAVEQYMSIYGSFVLITLGIIGNILSILIFLSPRYRRQSSHFYLLSLALSDLCFLIINLVEDTFRNHNNLYKSRINILDHSSSTICIFVQYARNITRLLSSWIIVAFTIERLLVVFYPLKRAFICRRKIARCVVLILFIMNLLINIHVPFHYGIINTSNSTNNNDTICDILPKYRSIYMRFAISTMITVYLVPMCIIGLVNMLICCKLWRKSVLTGKAENKQSYKRKSTLSNSIASTNLSVKQKSLQMSELSSPLSLSNRLQQAVNSTNQDQTMETFITSDRNILRNTDYSERNVKRIRTKSSVPSDSLINNTTNSKQSSTYVKTYIQSRTNRVTATLLLVSCSFLLLNTPYCAIWIANYVNNFSNDTLRSVKEITELFMLMNFSINFLLYCVSGKVFRAELAYLIRCQCNELYNRCEGERIINKKHYPTMNAQLQQLRGKFNSRTYIVKNPTYDPIKS